MSARWTRSVHRMLVTLAVVFVLVLLLVALFQRRLIYLPTRLDAKLADHIAEQNRVLPWRNGAGQIIGWRWPARESSPGAVLIVHGNAGSALDRDYLAAPIRDAAGLDVYVLEYPGYGSRAGSPTQRSLLMAADEAFDELAGRRRVFIVSESLGAGVAAHLAGTHSEQVSGVLMFSPYNTLVAVAQKTIPFLPMWLIVLDRFDPAGWLANYHGPVAVVVAGSDEVIPPELGRRLYDGYVGPKKLHLISGAHHNDIAAQPASWWKEVFAFWAEHPR